MKKVQILALHLNYGGIEKAISDLANNLVPYNNVEIVSTYKMDEKPAYKLDKRINVKYLINDLKPNREKFISYLKKFRFIKVLKEGFISVKVLFLKKHLMIKSIKSSDADIIISTRLFHNKLLTKYGDSNKTRIAWEHSHYHDDIKYFNKVVNSCKNLDYFVLVSKSLYKDYDNKMKNCKCKCVYIPNMITVDDDTKSLLNNKNIITVSRLSKEKGVFDLIKVMSAVHSIDKDVTLDLIGDGPLMNQISSCIKDASLENVIKLHGFKDTKYIDKKLSNSSLYVMTSYTESFGIVLLEAFSHGVPAVAFDSAEGACELINDSGVLIKNRDINKMAETIVSLLSNKKQLNLLSKNTSKEYKKYLPEVVIKSWLEIIK